MDQDLVGPYSLLDISMNNGLVAESAITQGY